MSTAARSYRRTEEHLLRTAASESEIAHAMEQMTAAHQRFASAYGYLVRGCTPHVDWVWGIDWTAPLDPTATFTSDADKPVSELDFERVRLTRVTALATMTEDMTGEWPSVRAALAEDGMLPPLERLPTPELPGPQVGDQTVGLGAVSFDSRPPLHPDPGDLWYNTAHHETWVWDGTIWLQLGIDPETTGLAGPVGPAGPTGPAGARGPAGMSAPIVWAPAAPLTS